MRRVLLLLYFRALLLLLQLLLVNIANAAFVFIAFIAFVVVVVVAFVFSVVIVVRSGVKMHEAAVANWATLVRASVRSKIDTRQLLIRIEFCEKERRTTRRSAR